MSLALEWFHELICIKLVTFRQPPEKEERIIYNSGPIFCNILLQQKDKMHPSRILLPTITLLLTVASLTEGSPVQATLSDDERQEIASLAVRILKLAVSSGNGPFFTNGKRNGGTIDSLYNLPDLITVGRR